MPRSGRPSTSTRDENVERVKKITIREAAKDIDVSVVSCHSFFSNVLSMKRVLAKFLPKLLNFDQKNRRMSIAHVLLTYVNDDPGGITGDETWVYGYDIEIEAQ
nr:uncharacterized protein LOC121126305 [Lepeophtheirus salmonis]